MTELELTAYSVLKNEDAPAYVGGNALIIADGLGGAGSTVHAIEREIHRNMYGELKESAFGDFGCETDGLREYIDLLLQPMSDEINDTSALWGSRIAIGRCAYALACGKFGDGNLEEPEARRELAEFILKGLNDTAERFALKKGKYDNQKLLPTTLAAVRFHEEETHVIAEAIWAGDSRVYALCADGLKALTEDDEDGSGAITNLFCAGEGARLNYRRISLKKPCALLAVSDGVFDPFEPYDNLGAEVALTSIIGNADDTDGFKEAFEEFYGKIRGDDATIAFKAFGFDGFGQLKSMLAPRTVFVGSVWEKLGKFGRLMQASSESDVKDYMLTRTADKLAGILRALVDGELNGKPDIAAGVFVREELEKQVRAVSEEIALKTTELLCPALEKLRLTLCADAAAANGALASDRQLHECGAPSARKRAWAVKKSAKNALRARQAYENALARTEAGERAEKLLLLTVESKIKDCRKNYDASRGSRDGIKLSRLAAEERFWQTAEIDFYLGRGTDSKGVAGADAEILKSLRRRIDDKRRLDGELEKSKYAYDVARGVYEKCVDKLIGCLKVRGGCAAEVLRPEICEKFGVAAPSADEKTVLSLAAERAYTALSDRKAGTCGRIVENLAANYGSVSAIDGFYNPTRLAAFRGFYSAKSDAGETEELKRVLESVQKGYFIV